MREQNFGVYGARRVWAALHRDGGVDGRAVARCTVERRRHVCENLQRAAGRHLRMPAGTFRQRTDLTISVSTHPRRSSNSGWPQRPDQRTPPPGHPTLRTTPGVCRGSTHGFRVQYQHQLRNPGPRRKDHPRAQESQAPRRADSEDPLTATDGVTPERSVRSTQ